LQRLKKKIFDIKMESGNIKSMSVWRLVYSGLIMVIGFFVSHCAQDNILAEFDGTIKIDSISPTSGVVGTEVRVYGKGFTPIAQNNEVSINGIKAMVLEPSSLSALRIKVPEKATTGNVILSVGNTIAQGPVFTVVDPPIILSVTPLQGFAGYRVFINGSKLGQISTIQFNEVDAEIFSKTDSDIVAIAPNSTTGNIEFLFPEGKVTGPVFTYLPIPVIDTAAVVRFSRLEDVIAFMGRYFSTDNLSLKVYLNGANATIRTVAVNDDGRPIVAISMPPEDTDNPTTLEIEADGIKSLPFEFVIPPILVDYKYNYIGNTMRIRLYLHGAYFGLEGPEKEVDVIKVENVNTAVPVKIISWTPRLITVELDIEHGEYYDVSVVIKEKTSEVFRFRP
jgi:hypothetical protein